MAKLVKKKVGIPRPEYPRPQFERASWVNLNGYWDFLQDPGISGKDRGLPEGEKFDQQILIPFAPESKLSGIENKDFMPCVWYSCRFLVSKGWTQKRVILHFGAVDYESTVWLNGIEIGTHQGGYTPFSLEITGHLKEGDNILVVQAIDDTRSTLQPSGKQSSQYDSYGCFYTRTTGIWQTVWMESVPNTYLETVKYYPDITNGRIGIIATINGKDDIQNTELEATVTFQGKKVGYTKISASALSVLNIELSEKHLWEPGSPNLYDIEYRLTNPNQSIDIVRSYFGLREITIKDKTILINHKPVFQRLVLDQGYYPDGVYTAPSDAALKKDIELSMAMGFNGARLHQKVFEPRFLYWADKLGYLVWGEYGDWGLDFNHPRLLETYIPEWNEAIQRDFNHPAIIGWCPFNETPRHQNQELIRKICYLTKLIDPSRPVIDTSGYHHVKTDIYDSHDYEQNPDIFAKRYKEFAKDDKAAFENDPGWQLAYQGQPYMVSEYGGIWWNPGQQDKKSWGYGNRPKTEKEFLERYNKLTSTLLNCPKIAGFCYTQLYDVEQEVNGLYTYNRKPKFDPEIIRKINQKKAAIEK